MRITAQPQSLLIGLIIGLALGGVSGYQIGTLKASPGGIFSAAKNGQTGPLNQPTIGSAEEQQESALPRSFTKLISKAKVVDGFVVKKEGTALWVRDASDPDVTSAGLRVTTRNSTKYQFLHTNTQTKKVQARQGHFEGINTGMSVSVFLLQDADKNNFVADYIIYRSN